MKQRYRWNEFPVVRRHHVHLVEEQERPFYIDG